MTWRKHTHTGLVAPQLPQLGLTAVLGVFAMLYIRERRLFVLIKASGETLVALSSNRKSLDVDESFRQHRDALATLLNPNAGPSARS